MVAVVTPAAVVPLAVKPVAPLPPKPEVLISHSYPFVGNDGDAAQDKLADVGDVYDTDKDPGATQEGGVQVYVNPEAGLTVFDRDTVELFNVPAVVDVQFVVVVLLLKLEFELPLKPISNVLAVALTGPCIL